MTLDIKQFLESPAPLGDWIKRCISEPGLGLWLLRKASDEEYTLEDLIYPISDRRDELSDEYYELVDDSVHSCGYEHFLNLDQLEDIIHNLASQIGDYSESDLLKAINHYMETDAFIVLPTEG